GGPCHTDHLFGLAIERFEFAISERPAGARVRVDFRQWVEVGFAEPERHATVEHGGATHTVVGPDRTWPGTAHVAPAGFLVEPSTQAAHRLGEPVLGAAGDPVAALEEGDPT